MLSVRMEGVIKTKHFVDLTTCHNILLLLWLYKNVTQMDKSCDSYGFCFWACTQTAGTWRTVNTIKKSRNLLWREDNLLPVFLCLLRNRTNSSRLTGLVAFTMPKLTYTTIISTHQDKASDEERKQGDKQCVIFESWGLNRQRMAHWESSSSVSRDTVTPSHWLFGQTRRLFTGPINSQCKL